MAGFLANQRAGATAIANFFLALLVGAIVTWIVHAITTPLFAHANEAGSDPVATQTTGWLETFAGNIPMLFLFFSFFSLLAITVFEREVLRT